ncbi:MAG: hypothetical protein GF384_03810 [Elusimicrobia bacterium]|nr:hypothetical protein [Elusimicrobiota bacterium]MBD3412029.1 hypothetical protein [Elusimicrobiota bacterium]
MNRGAEQENNYLVHIDPSLGWVNNIIIKVNQKEIFNAKPRIFPDIPTGEGQVIEFSADKKTIDLQVLIPEKNINFTQSFDTQNGMAFDITYGSYEKDTLHIDQKQTLMFE